MQNKITIDETFLQESAIGQIGRELTPGEIEEVFDNLSDGLVMLLSEGLQSAVEFSEMMKRNEGAGNSYPYYGVYWRNPNASQDSFKLVAVFKTKDDARHFVRRRGGDSFEGWKIMKVVSGDRIRGILEVEDVSIREFLVKDFEDDE